MSLESTISEIYNEEGLQDTKRWWLSNPHHVALTALASTELLTGFLETTDLSQDLIDGCASDVGIPLTAAFWFVSQLFNDRNYNKFPKDDGYVKTALHRPSIPVMYSFLPAFIYGLSTGNFHDAVALPAATLMTSTAFAQSASIQQEPSTTTDRVLQSPTLPILGSIAAVIAQPALEPLLTHSHSLSAFYNDLSPVSQLTLLAAITPSL